MYSSPWMWAALGALLLMQNFSFTVVSRARNSGSDLFHAAASVFSNGIWVVVNVLLFRQWMEVWDTRSPALLAGVAAFYIVFTVIGSVYGGKISRRYFEKGNRQVGHYDAKEARLKRLEDLVEMLVADEWTDAIEGYMDPNHPRHEAGARTGGRLPAEDFTS